MKLSRRRAARLVGALPAKSADLRTGGGAGSALSSPARKPMMPRMSVSLVTTKAQQRASALARRDALPVADRRAASQKIAQRRFPVPFGEGTVVAGYSPVRSECDPIPLMRSLAGKGAQLALPVSRRTRRCRSPNGVRASSCRRPVRHPAAAPSALDVEPDIILVPLVGFDRAMHRIGYGVGYYDRALKALRAKKPGDRGRHRLCDPGDRCGRCQRQRRASRSRVDRARDHRSRRKVN